jgi:hypothetical protein
VVSLVTVCPAALVYTVVDSVIHEGNCWVAAMIYTQALNAK